MKEIPTAVLTAYDKDGKGYDIPAITPPIYERADWDIDENKSNSIQHRPLYKKIQPVSYTIGPGCDYDPVEAREPVDISNLSQFRDITENSKFTMKNITDPNAPSEEIPLYAFDVYDIMPNPEEEGLIPDALYYLTDSTEEEIRQMMEGETIPYEIVCIIYKNAQLFDLPYPALFVLDMKDPSQKYEIIGEGTSIQIKNEYKQVFEKDLLEDDPQSLQYIKNNPFLPKYIKYDGENNMSHLVKYYEKTSSLTTDIPMSSVLQENAIYMLKFVFNDCPYSDTAYGVEKVILKAEVTFSDYGYQTIELLPIEGYAAPFDKIEQSMLNDHSGYSSLSISLRSDTPSITSVYYSLYLLGNGMDESFKPMSYKELSAQYDYRSHAFETDIAPGSSAFFPRACDVQDYVQNQFTEKVGPLQYEDYNRTLRLGEQYGSEGYKLALENFTIADHHGENGTYRMPYVDEKVNPLLDNTTVIANFYGGFSAGKDANTYKDAIQLGAGKNTEEKSLQIYDKKLMDGQGNVPLERLEKLKEITELKEEQVTQDNPTLSKIIECDQLINTKEIQTCILQSKNLLPFNQKDSNYYEKDQSIGWPYLHVTVNKTGTISLYAHEATATSYPIFVNRFFAQPTKFFVIADNTTDLHITVKYENEEPQVLQSPTILKAGFIVYIFFSLTRKHPSPLTFKPVLTWDQTENQALPFSAPQGNIEICSDNLFDISKVPQEFQSVANNGIKIMTTTTADEIVIPVIAIKNTPMYLSAMFNSVFCQNNIQIYIRDTTDTLIYEKGKFIPYTSSITKSVDLVIKILSKTENLYLSNISWSTDEYFSFSPCRKKICEIDHTVITSKQEIQLQCDFQPKYYFYAGNDNFYISQFSFYPSKVQQSDFINMNIDNQSYIKNRPFYAYQNNQVLTPHTFLKKDGFNEIDDTTEGYAYSIEFHSQSFLEEGKKYKFRILLTKPISDGEITATAMTSGAVAVQNNQWYLGQEWFDFDPFYINDFSIIFIPERQVISFESYGVYDDTFPPLVKGFEFLNEDGTPALWLWPQEQYKTLDKKFIPTEEIISDIILPNEQNEKHNYSIYVDANGNLKARLKEAN